MLEDSLPKGWDGDDWMPILLAGMDGDAGWACTVALLERMISLTPLGYYWFRYWLDYDDVVIG